MRNKTKNCKKCNIFLTKDNTKFVKNYTNTLASRCTKCINSDKREFRINNPNSVKNTELKTNYGITLVEYNVMLEKQNNCCKICKIPHKSVETFGRALAVDHCHTTEKIRGLLCSYCNTGIGIFSEDVGLLAEAMKYLGAVRIGYETAEDVECA